MGRARKSPTIDSPTSAGPARRARGASGAALAERLTGLELRLATLERVVRDLIAQQAPPPAAPLRPASQPASNPHVLEGAVLDAIRALDREGRLDGLVPIPAVRRRLASFERPQLDRALLELERVFRIDLKIANDPLAVEAAGEGIPHPARGLLYYAVVR